jgi:hypothetical protein
LEGVGGVGEGEGGEDEEKGEGREVAVAHGTSL